MQTQQIGFIGYKLYSLGWRSGLRNRLPLLQHLLLSIFLYYRRGFADGSERTEEYCLKKNSL